MIFILSSFFKKIAENIPGFRSKLVQAGILDEPEKFIEKIAVTALYVLFSLFVFVLILYFMFPDAILFFIGISIFLFGFIIFYLFNIPDLKIIRKEREINKEIAFAGRFLSIELSSGVPLYDAVKNVALNYKHAGRPFSEIVTKVDLGTPIEEAIEDSIQSTPSKFLRKILWQILNSLRTGTDIIRSLNTVVEQIVRQQTTEIKKYGKKLSPLAMFYMMIAIIFPTLGIVMLIVISGFISIEINLFFLILIALLLGFLQFLFLATIRSSRPEIEI